MFQSIQRVISVNFHTSILQNPFSKIAVKSIFLIELTNKPIQAWNKLIILLRGVKLFKQMRKDYVGLVSYFLFRIASHKVAIFVRTEGVIHMCTFYCISIEVVIPYNISIIKNVSPNKVTSWKSSPLGCSRCVGFKIASYPFSARN